MAEQFTPDRFWKMVDRIADWTDSEVARVSPEQVRHIARVVRDGADPVYPPFGDDAPPAQHLVVAPARCSGKSYFLESVRTAVMASEEVAELCRALAPFAAIADEWERWQAKGSTSTPAMIRFTYGRRTVGLPEYQAARAALSAFPPKGLPWAERG